MLESFEKLEERGLSIERANWKQNCYCKIIDGVAKPMQRSEAVGFDTSTCTITCKLLNTVLILPFAFFSFQLLHSGSNIIARARKDMSLFLNHLRVSTSCYSGVPPLSRKISSFSNQRSPSPGLRIITSPSDPSCTSSKSTRPPTS